MCARWIVGLCVLVGSAHASNDQEETLSRVRHELLNRGYENIAVQTTDDVLVVWCENRRIRYPVAWMVEALWLVSSSVSAERRVRVIAQKLAMPVVSLEAHAGDVVEWMGGALPTDEFRRGLVVEYAGSSRPPGRLNPSLRRADLILGPGRLLTEFGLPGEIWVRANFDASAELTTALAAGLTAYGRVFIPLHHKGGPVDNEDRYLELRPGSFLLSYFHPLGPSGFSTVTAGVFELRNWRYDSYGVVVDMRQSTSDGRWAIGGSFGHLGSATYRVLSSNDRPHRYRIWEIVWPPDEWPYGAFIEYRFEGLDLHLTARWGRFLADDRAWRLDVERKFGEFSLTIFGIKSDAGGVDPNNVRLLGGVRMEVPLYPREQGMPSRLRVASAGSYAWAYRYRVGHVGVDVDTGHRVSDVVEGYTPTQVRNNLERARAQVRAFRLQEGRSRREVTTSTNAGDGSH